MQTAPVYQIYTWRRTHANEREFRYRPTFRTALRRLGITALCLIFAIGIAWAFHIPQVHPGPAFTPEEQRELEVAQSEISASMEEVLGAEAVAEIEREVAAAHAEREQRAAVQHGRDAQIRQSLGFVRNSVIGILLFVGVYAPLSCLWGRLVVRRNDRDELEISTGFFWRRTKRWPLADLRPIRTVAKEQYGFSRYGRIDRHYWVWFVQLPLSGTFFQTPVFGQPGLTFGAISPQFLVLQQKFQPTLAGRAPEAVRELVKGLRAVTGLSAEPPQLLEGRVVGRKKVAYHSAFPIDPGEQVTHEEHVIRPGEPIPDHIRKVFQGTAGDLTEGPPGVTRTVSREIVVRDEHGNETTYNTIDDLPEIIQRRLEGRR